MPPPSLAAPSALAPLAAPAPKPYEAFFVLRFDPKPLAPPRVTLSSPLTPQQLLLRFPMLGQFCFPERLKTVSFGEVEFTFVLTDASGLHLFGHCTRTINAEVHGIISHFPWCRLFHGLISAYRYNGEDLTVIEALGRSSLPDSGHGFMLTPKDEAANSTRGVDSLRRSFGTSAAAPSVPSMDVRKVTMCRPPDAYNPFVDVSPSILCRWMNADTLLSTIAALLSERRVAIVGPDVGVVSHVILGLLSLLRPFEWHHVLVPVVPHNLLTVLAAPTPFLAGVVQSQLQPALALGGVNHLIVVVLEGCCGVSDTNGPQEGAKYPSHVELVHQDDEEEYMPPPTLPWTSSALCPLRLAIAKARRVMKKKSGGRVSTPRDLVEAGTVDADRLVLNAFMDYYVHAFGRALSPTFEPATFILELEKRGDATNARSFFSAVVESILFMQFRDRYVPALERLEHEAGRSVVTSLDGWLPETCGFAEAALLTVKDMYPCCSPLAETALREREKDPSRPAATLVSLQAPIWSWRTLGRLCAYGIESVIASHIESAHSHVHTLRVSRPPSPNKRAPPRSVSGDRK